MKSILCAIYLGKIMVDLRFLFYANLITFILYAFDKLQEKRCIWRIPEIILFLSALFGGGFGALCAMILYKHKTEVGLFRIGVPVLLYIQLTIEVLYRMGFIF